MTTDRYQTGRIQTGKTRLVTAASTAGTVFEWYDFFLYITMATAIAHNFFASANATSANIFALLAFATGFVVRPFGALVFGRLGDLFGRKHTFLATIVIMGVSTIFVGLLPTYETAGILAPVLLTVLRMVQGLAIGGEYGGAATYVAEHAPAGRRGAMTAWLQASATLGFALSVAVVMLTRNMMGADTFLEWGWRIPFLASSILLSISIWIRLKLEESPLFLSMKEAGELSKSPIRETFSSRKNVKLFVVAILGVVMGQSVVYVAGQIYALVFLTATLKVDPQIANLLVLCALVLGLPAFVISGYMSDKIGRKPIILAACLLGAFGYMPLYKALGHYANPALEAATANAPIIVAANIDECSVQFNPVGTSRFTSSCDVAKNALLNAGVPFLTRDAGPGATATVSIGDTTLQSASLVDADGVAQFKSKLKEALVTAKYPATAKPEEINYPMVLVVLTIMSLLGAMSFGPIAAALTEFFPSRIRYTSVSVTYNLGNGWFGGLLPAAATALQVATGNIYGGIWYPVVIAALTFVIGVTFLPSEHAKSVPLHS
ncbi:MFS transporter [Rhizobium sp. 16-449-1b]|nr:MFS transporter [Rhizobium sp. 16-449-1b]